MLDLHLPISGTLPALQEPDGSMSVCVTMVTGKVCKIEMREQMIAELNLHIAAAQETA